MEAKYRRSNTMCCVVGCNNSYNNTDANIKFYSFPGKWYEKERRQIWIKAVRRCSGSREPWEPQIHHKVCSKHFINGVKSNNALSPSYNPTIFPSIYRSVGDENVDMKITRFERARARSVKKVSTITSTVTANSQQDHEEIQLEVRHKEEFSCQVDMGNEDVNFVFECIFSSNCQDISTQVNIPKTNVSMTPTSDKCVGNSDDIACEGFHGYQSVKTDHQLNSLCGVTFARFVFLLSFLDPVHKNSKLSIENQLIMFLMKIKLGISNAVLGIFFTLHDTSCSRIFLRILNQLTDKLAHLVRWPSREVINATMPESFKLHYPQCRVIIDCTELKIQRPNRVDHRIFTYSNYKGTFTGKFLVGIAPNGFVMFISKCYGGRASDSFITNDCGILDLLEPGDVVLSDKGFPGIKCKDDVIVVMPPFVHEGALNFEEVLDTYNIASVRIHVERSIQRIKIYNILQKISSCLFPYIDKIILMCSILVNLQPPIINQDDSDMHQDSDMHENSDMHMHQDSDIYQDSDMTEHENDI